MTDRVPMIVSTIAVYNSLTGELRDVAPAGAVPSGYSSCPLPVGYAPATWRWNVAKRTMIEDPALLETTLITAINDQREARQMLALTQGGAKKTVYAKQQAEVLAWAGLGAIGATTVQLVAAFNLLPLTVQKQKFRFAVVSAAKRGEANIAAAIKRFSDGASKSDVEVSRVEAIAQDAIDAIRAASTAAAKRAIFAAIDWTWKPA